MLSKFKVGDIVEVIESTWEFKLGDILAVTSVNGCFVRFNGHDDGWLQNYFKLAEIEVGDIVETLRSTDRHCKGAIVTVTSLHRDFIRVEGEQTGNYKETFKLIKKANKEIMNTTHNGVNGNNTPLNFTEADLKDWMRIKTQDGRTAIVATKDGRKIVCYGALNGYDDIHLFSKDYPYANIVEVYGTPQFNQMLDVGMVGKLLWKALPQKTEQQLAIEKLEDTIKQAQEDLVQLKRSL